MLLCFRVHEGKDEGVLVSAFLFVGASFGGGLLCSLFLILFFLCLLGLYVLLRLYTESIIFYVLLPL